MNKEILKQTGINYEKGAARCLGDTGLYEEILEAFLEDPTFDQAKEALEQKDNQLLFNCVHTMKGLAGNLDITELYETSCALTESLRGRTQLQEGILESQFAAMQKAYLRARDGIIAAKEK